jgi:hypothetical protein
MAALEEARRQIDDARRGLEQSRANAAAWSDAQRAQLDRSVLDPMTADVLRLSLALAYAARDIDLARQRLVHPY